MGLLKIEGVTHWSIPVNDLTEAEKFYGDLLGLKPLGRLGNSGMSCFNVGDHNILLCEREQSVDKSFSEDYKVHHSFTVSPDTLVQACKIFYERKIPIDRLYYRAKGFFTGRELYFFDPEWQSARIARPDLESRDARAFIRRNRALVNRISAGLSLPYAVNRNCHPFHWADRTAYLERVRSHVPLCPLPIDACLQF